MAILRGEIEALQDGVRSLNTGTLESLHAEILRLIKLVDGLHQLSLADSQCLLAQKNPVKPLAVLAEMVELFRSRFERRNISMTMGPGSRPPALTVGARWRATSERTHLH
ncbi:MAG: hypothetical protein WAU91_19835 [Desulfatitalea sp.]